MAISALSAAFDLGGTRLDRAKQRQQEIDSRVADGLATPSDKFIFVG